MKQLSLVLLAALLALERLRLEGQRRSTSPPSSRTSRIPRSASRSSGAQAWAVAARSCASGLGLATSGNKLFAAGRDGDVAAFDLKTGKQLWRIETKLELAGGTGVGADPSPWVRPTVRCVALAMDTGAQRWRADVKGEILSAPAVADERSRRAHRRRQAARARPRRWQGNLVRGTADSAPHVAWRRRARRGARPRDFRFRQRPRARGQPDRWRDGLGFTRCRRRMAAPSSNASTTSTLAVKVLGDEVFVAGFQGRAAMLALDSGQVWWTREVSSYRGVDVDDRPYVRVHVPGRTAGDHAPHRPAGVGATRC